MEQPKKIIRIALDDYLEPLKGRIKAETLGKVNDELARSIPNMLKDEKKRVEYKKNDPSQHVFLLDPKHPVIITHIEENEL